MNNFKDFKIIPAVLNFTGEKIKIDRVLNVEIKIHDFKVDNSKHKVGTEYLTLQIEKAGVKHIIFTGSTILIQMIKQVPKTKFPFTTVIKRENEYYEFT